MRIALIGYGKMGHMIESIALQRGHEIACRIDVHHTQGEGETVYTPEEGFTSEAFRSADVAIEFTTPATAKDNILRAWAQGVPVVSGSTGWKPEELPIQNYELRIKNYELKITNYELRIEDNKTVIRDANGRKMLVWSSNFSVGVNIFFDVNKVLAAYMANQPQYSPSICETHHIHKLDAPSGTAKTLCEQIQNSKFKNQNYDIPIESIREGEVPGTHVVTWDSPEDTIVITHIAKGRQGFALGAVLAAEQIKA